LKVLICTYVYIDVLFASWVATVIIMFSVCGLDINMVHLREIRNVHHDIYDVFVLKMCWRCR